MKAIFTYDGDKVLLWDVEQMGYEKWNFSDFVNPLVYAVAKFNDGIPEAHEYTVRIFNLPIVFVETEDGQPIVSKDDWLSGSFTIRNTDGTIDSLGVTNIKGRGNTSWKQQEKKPYTIKLEKKQKLLGMHKHKRWQLMSTYGNSMSFFRDDFMFYIARHTASLGWAPHGRYAELFINGEHKGLYWICEMISIDNHRVDIKKLKPEDVHPDSITGGYLLEFADKEKPNFYTDTYNYLLRLNDPDENVPQVQMDYIKGYFNELEACHMDSVRLTNHEYEEYLDVESWIDYWLMHEMANSTDIKLYGSPGLSCFCYKDGGGKLKAGPVWDMHMSAKSGAGYHAKDALYYDRLFKDMKFVERVKEKWYGTDTELGFVDQVGDVESRVDSIAALIQQAGDRDFKIWNKDASIDAQAKRAKSVYKNNIRWMNYCVKDLPYTTGIDVPEDITELAQLQVATDAIFSLSGLRINALQRGINIIRKLDGSVQKVMIK